MLRDNQDGICWDGVLDFSGEGVDISELPGFYMNYYWSSPATLGVRFKGFNFKNKTFKKYMGDSSTNIGNNYFLSGPIKCWSTGIAAGMQFNTLIFDGVTVDNSSITNFGRLQSNQGEYITRADLNLTLSGKNMKLKQMKTIDIQYANSYHSVDISGTEAPKATDLIISAMNQSSSADTSPYSSYRPYTIGNEASFPDLLKSINIKDIIMPNLKHLSFHYLYNLETIEMNLNTGNLTSLKDLFRWCPKLTEDTALLEIFTTTNVSDMSGAFSHCTIGNYSKLST
jgi:hypothetical protein